MPDPDNRTSPPPRNFSAGSRTRRNDPLAPGGPFPMLSFDTVERLLQEEARATGQADSARTRTARTPAVPPPLFGAAAGAAPAHAPTSPPPSPAPVQPPPSASTDGTRLADLVGPDGGVDIEAVYRLGRVPDSPLSAELLRRALAGLPADVPERARRAALQVTVTTLAQTAGVSAEAVLTDARLRRKRLEQYLIGLEGELWKQTQPVHREIERLEAELAAQRALLEAPERTLAWARAGCHARMTDLEEIVRLLQPEEADERTAPAAQAEEDEDLPPFLREDAVMRMLAAREAESAAAEAR